MKNKFRILLPILLFFAFVFQGCSDPVKDSPVVAVYDSTENQSSSNSEINNDTIKSESLNGQISSSKISLEDIPDYSGSPYYIINSNIPNFTDEEITDKSFEQYSELDSLGRCGIAYACLGEDLMPTEERQDISDVYPTGWEQKDYEGIDGGYIYNRCHLIGFQLTGENANEKNLITGTRYMNTEGMLPYENIVADYIKETGNHVMYRITPIFAGEDLLASGVQMEALSVEDNGEGVSFNVYCYNLQPGITIDYSTGNNYETAATNTDPVGTENTYILNTNSQKFHYPNCSGVSDMSERNKQEFTGTRDEIINMGYEPCGICNP